MRTRLALLGLGIGVAASLLPVSPASANCQIEYEGRCYNACTIVLGHVPDNKVLPRDCPQ